MKRHLWMTLKAWHATPYLVLLLSGICLGLFACQSGKTAPQQRYELQGKVVSVDPQRRYVTISHESIPGYMEGMTMPFALKEQWAYGVLAAGDRVHATLVVTAERSWLEDLAITKVSATAETDTSKGLAQVGPQPGDVVPNFSLVNQDAQAIQLQQYRGKALVLTFIYTRCPLPDFCPKMVDNFAATNRALQQNPALYDKTHLLCISFDPAHDTPSLLHAYGAAYVGSDGPESFTHWEFASGTPDEVKEIAQFFGLLYLPQTDQIAHSLRTAVITPEGKVFKLYTDNLWTPAGLLRDVEQVLSH